MAFEQIGSVRLISRLFKITDWLADLVLDGMYKGRSNRRLEAILNARINALENARNHRDSVLILADILSILEEYMARDNLRPQKARELGQAFSRAMMVIESYQDALPKA